MNFRFKISQMSETKRESPKICWELTLNNPTDADVAWIKAVPASGCVASLEVGENGTRHIQAKIRFMSKKRLAQVRKLCPRGHWEPSVAPRAWEYPIKAGSEVLRNEPFKTKAGKRVDLERARELIASKKRKADLMTDPDLDEAMAKYPAWCDGVFNSTRYVEYDIMEAKEWQEKVWDFCETDPDDRTIYWFYDLVGGAGKTVLTKLLTFNTDAVQAMGEYKRIAYMYDYQKTVIFNFPRSQDLEKVSYRAMEHLKDGAIFSSMYHPIWKRFESPHVLVFANGRPPLGKLSHDRIVEIDVTRPFDLNLNPPQ